MSAKAASYCGLVAILLVCCFGAAADQKPDIRDDILLTDAEIANIIQHGPWPPAPKTDRSNRVSGNQTAISDEFGYITHIEYRN